MDMPSKDVREAIRGAGCPSVMMGDKLYHLPPLSWLRQDFLPWWRFFVTRAGLRYRAEGWDCDDFACVFRAQMILATRPARNELGRAAGIACGELTATGSPQGRPDWNGLHRLNVVGVVEAGQPLWLALEPQTGEFTSLRDYPAALFFCWL